MERGYFLLYVSSEGAGTILEARGGCAEEKEPSANDISRMWEKFGGGEPAEYGIDIESIQRSGLYVYSCDVDYDDYDGEGDSVEISDKDLKLATSDDILEHFGYPTSPGGEVLLVGLRLTEGKSR